MGLATNLNCCRTFSISIIWMTENSTNDQLFDAKKLHIFILVWRRPWFRKDKNQESLNKAPFFWLGILGKVILFHFRFAWLPDYAVRFQRWCVRNRWRSLQRHSGWILSTWSRYWRLYSAICSRWSGLVQLNSGLLGVQSEKQPIEATCKVEWMPFIWYYVLRKE